MKTGMKTGRRGMFVALCALAVAVVLTVGAPRASADLIFNLTTGNSVMSAYSGPFAQVDVHWIDATHATVTFDALPMGASKFLFTDSGAAGVNVSGAFSATFSGTNTLPGFSGVDLSLGNGQEDGFGSFNLNVDEKDSFTWALSQITFNLTATGGNTWADALHVLTANADGFLAAAHVGACGPAPSSGLCSIDTPFNNTGYVSTGVPVPDGGMTLMLLGGALVGLATLGRKFRG